MNCLVSDLGATSTDPIRSNVPRNSLRKLYTAAIALDKQTAEDAFRVRYASYLESGFIDPNPDRIFRDEFDYLPNTTTIVVYHGEKAVASVRVCFLSQPVRDAPSHHAFSQEVDGVLAEVTGGCDTVEIVEITRLVRSPECANNQGLVFLLYRLAAYLALRHDVQAILSSVRRNHIGFYHRLGFEEIAGPLPYPGLKCPMHLLKCARVDYDRVMDSFPLLDPHATPRGTFDGFLSGRPIAMPLMFA